MKRARKERNREELQKQLENNEVEINTFLSIKTLNGLNSPIKRHTEAGWVKIGYMYTMEHYSAIKKKALPFAENGWTFWVLC